MNYNTKEEIYYDRCVSCINDQTEIDGTGCTCIKTKMKPINGKKPLDWALKEIEMSKEDLTKQLEANFGEDALSVDSSRGFKLTSIKAQYIKERLNSIFGPFGWSMTGRYEANERGVIYHGKLILKEHNHEVETIGFSAMKKNLGDSYKSAQTDCLSKAASFLGIGNEVFKGNVDPNTLATTSVAPQQVAASFNDKTQPMPPQESQQNKVCPVCGKNMLLRNGKYGQFWGCSGFPGCKTMEKA